jgi:hypothetical protein
MRNIFKHELEGEFKLSEKEEMSDNFNLGRSNFRYRNHFFKISFLLFQLAFCSMLMFYILRKSELGISLAEKFMK